jgi:signal transduction histidine kinase
MDNVLFPDMDVDPEGLTPEELILKLKKCGSMLKEAAILANGYRRSEDALRLDEARLEALLKLNDMAAAPEVEIITYALEEAIRLTGSKIGWMGALSPDEKTLVMHCWSKGTRDECGIVDRPHSLNIASGGLWVEPIARRKPVIINDILKYRARGVPCGHVHVERFMGVPIYDGGSIIAVAEVGNKESDYNGPDLRQLSLLMSGVWRIILRKRAEEALSESRYQAELYVDFMGHDINNMNQIAMGFLEIALEKLDTTGKLEGKDKNILEKPMETMRNSARLIDNVKKLQRLKSGMFETSLYDLGSVLGEIAKGIRSTPGRNITVKFDSINGHYVKANELLKDVFSNIVENSVKHSRPNKPLIISINIEPGLHGYHKISLEDNGPGIPDSRKGEIFDRLSQVKMKTLRTGLGLGLVKTLVESYKGRIWVEDRVPGDPSMGCRFIVMLPETRPNGT